MKNSGIIDKEFPNRLYVTEKAHMYPMHEVTYLAGTGHLEGRRSRRQ